MSNKWIPECAIPPGWLLEEHLEVRGYSQAEFARRCGRTPKLISEIISGKAPLTPTTALQFEKVLGLDAKIWIGIETKYRLFVARESEVNVDETSIEWAKRFPVTELVNRGYLARPKSLSDRVSALLAFFRVASVDVWNAIVVRPVWTIVILQVFQAHQSLYLHGFVLEKLRLNSRTASRITLVDFRRLFMPPVI